MKLKITTRFGGFFIACVLALSGFDAFAAQALRLTDQIVSDKGKPVVNGYVYIGSYEQDPVANPLTLYSDAALTTPIANPQRTDSYGRPVNDIYIAEARYSYQLKDVNLVGIEGPKNRIAFATADVVVRNVATVAALKALKGMIDGQRVATLGYYSAGDGGHGQYRWDAASTETDDGGAVIQATGIVTGRWKLLSDLPINVDQFGARGDGVTNDSTPLFNFYTFAIANPSFEYLINCGTYSITLGTLSFDNGFVDTQFPTIRTAGHHCVKFTSVADTDAPFLKFTNGTASSGVGQYWRGGYHGGFTCDRVAGSGAKTAQNCLTLRGFWKTNFGYIRGDDLGGDTVHIEQKLFGGTNPDPYAVTAVFDGIEGNRNSGYTFKNNNYVGFNASRIGFLRAIENTSGGFFGYGAGNIVDIASMGSVSGWAFQEGGNTGGSPSRFRLNIAELDNVENGFQINRLSEYTISARFVHRFQTTPNADPDYWPREAVDFSDGTSTTSTNRGTFTLIHRIEAGGVKADLGEFIDLASQGGDILALDVDQQIVDGPGFGFTDADNYANLNLNSTLVIRNSGREVVNSKTEPLLKARISAAQNVATSDTTLIWDSVISDNDTILNTSTGEITVKSPGFYHVWGQITVTGHADGEGIRTQVKLNGGQSDVAITYAKGTSIWTIYFDDVVQSTVAGDVIVVSANTDAGAARPITTGLANSKIYVKRLM